MSVMQRPVICGRERERGAGQEIHIWSFPYQRIEDVESNSASRVSFTISLPCPVRASSAQHTHTHLHLYNIRVCIVCCPAAVDGRDEFRREESTTPLCTPLHADAGERQALESQRRRRRTYIPFWYFMGWQKRHGKGRQQQLDL